MEIHRLMSSTGSIVTLFDVYTANYPATEEKITIDLFIGFAIISP
jgi:hypothetical protein